MSTQMTQKQRVALEAREAAQREGKPLSGYAKERGLVIRELYDALACLRRNGALPRSGRKPRSKFVAVRVAAEDAPRQGLRDHALLLLLYNTGARVSEALGVRAEHLSLADPRHVRLFSKGNRERICPLWRDTAAALHRLQAVRNAQPQDWMFCNRGGVCLTRDGVAYILQKYTASAARKTPALKLRHVTPHTLRHSCAVALLQAGVDITVIRDYLGHVSISTTSRYVSTNLQMKRDALEHFWERSGLSAARARPWSPKPDLLAFLASI